MKSDTYYRNLLEHIDAEPGLSRFDLVTHLIGRGVTSTNHGENLVGDVFFRPMIFTEAGETVNGHTHGFNHATLLAQGSLLVSIAQPPAPVMIDGVERTPDDPIYSKERTLIAPAIIPIDRGLWHRFVALEPSVAFCCYVPRDPFTGAPALEWNGNWAAFG